MKSTRNVASTILATLGISLAFASVHAQSTPAQSTEAAPQSSSIPAAKSPGMGQGMGQGAGQGKHRGHHDGMKSQRSEMSKLMTPEERTEMRNKMQAAKTSEERQALRTSMRAEMQKRAKEKGITLPDHQGGRQHRHGAHSG